MVSIGTVQDYFLGFAELIFQFLFRPIQIAHGNSK